MHFLEQPAKKRFSKRKARCFFAFPAFAMLENSSVVEPKHLAMPPCVMYKEFMECSNEIF
jgi:hypothetical protein